MGGIPWITRRFHEIVRRRSSGERELGQGGFAEHHGARAAQAFHHRRVVSRDPVLQHARGRRRAHSRGGHVVLVRDGDAVERTPGPATSDLGLGLARLGQADFPSERDSAAERGVEAFETQIDRAGKAVAIEVDIQRMRPKKRQRYLGDVATGAA